MRISKSILYVWSILLGLCFLAAAYPTRPTLATVVSQPLPSPTALSISLSTTQQSAEDRILLLEQQVNELRNNSSKPSKDIWDILQAVSGLITGGLVVVAGYWINAQIQRRQQVDAQENKLREEKIKEQQRIADEMHRAHELQVSRSTLVHTFIPQLQSNDDRARETALLVLSALGDQELALALANIYAKRGGQEVIEHLASSPDQAIAQAAENSLEQLQPQSIRKLVNEVLATLARPYEDDITDRVFITIENDPQLRTRYNQLREQLGDSTLNSGIGRSVKILTGLRDLGAPRGIPKSSLIRSYSRLG